MMGIGSGDLSMFFMVVAAILFVIPLFYKPCRKIMGVINIIFGFCLMATGIGIFLGIPMIIYGGILYVVGKKTISIEWMTTEVIEKEIGNAQVALGIATSNEIDQY